MYLERNLSMHSIRKATLKDAVALGSIHALSWREAYEGIIPSEVLKNITPEKRTLFFENALTLGWEEDFLLLVDSQPAGLLCLGPARDADLSGEAGEIWGIYLHPYYYGKGYGKILMDFGLQVLETRGYQKAMLWVLKDNNRAISFYEKIGFAPDGLEKEIHIGTALTEIRYQKNL